FAALAFIIPVTGIGRDYISTPLASITARVTQELCEALGMDVGRFGNMLQINGHDIVVAEACNGLRMVWPLFLITYVFAFVTPMRRQLRVTVLAMAPLLAVVANVIRLVPTVWVYGHASAATAATFHDLAGWAMLIGAFLALLMIARLLPGSQGIPSPAAPRRI